LLSNTVALMCEPPISMESTFNCEDVSLMILSGRQK
jgi:hypothetical protein